MARPSTQNLKRQELLEKAAVIFKRYGYDKTNLEDISKAMNLNKATLYYYVKNKEQLFFEVLLSECTQMLEELNKQTLLKKTPEAQIKYYFSKRVGLYASMVRLGCLTKEQLLVIQPAFMKIYHDVFSNDHHFVAAIVVQYFNGKLPANKLKECVNLLFDVSYAYKNEAAAFGDLIENNETISIIQNKILKTQQHILQSFQAI
ncbi:MAG: hypothetical protein RIQ89_233 [Bacteroidota bacterium]